jgi:hypothetical protein
MVISGGLAVFAGTRLLTATDVAILKGVISHWRGVQTPSRIDLDGVLIDTAARGGVPPNSRPPPGQDYKAASAFMARSEDRNIIELDHIHSEDRKAAC